MTPPIVAHSSEKRSGCVSFRDVEEALLKFAMGLKDEINILYSGNLPKSHWGTPENDDRWIDIWAPKNRDSAVIGVVAYIMERLIWPNNPGYLLSENVYLLHRGKLQHLRDRIQDALHLCDPATIFPPLPPFPSENGADKGKKPSTQQSDEKHHRLDEGETFRPSAIMDFTVFGNNRQHNHPFMDRQRWTILDEPKFFLSQNNVEEDELRKIWSKLKPFSGAELVFRIPSGTSGIAWKRASEIAVSMEPELISIFRQKLPRKGSAAEFEFIKYAIARRTALGEDEEANFNHEDAGKMLGIKHNVFGEKNGDVVVKDSRVARRAYVDIQNRLKLLKEERNKANKSK